MSSSDTNSFLDTFTHGYGNVPFQGTAGLNVSEGWAVGNGFWVMNWQFPSVPMLSIPVPTPVPPDTDLDGLANILKGPYDDLEPYGSICYLPDWNCVPAAKPKPKTQTGLVRENICPEGWPKHSKSLLYALVCCSRFSREDTAHAQTVKDALQALRSESENDPNSVDFSFNAKTFDLQSEDVPKVRATLLRLFDWIESRFHYGTHRLWYLYPDCFSENPEKAHLANIGVAQRHLANLPERDYARWEEIHKRV